MDSYAKATEVLLMLHKIAQLICNDKDYPPFFQQDISNCITRAEMIQFDIEAAEE